MGQCVEPCVRREEDETEPPPTKSASTNRNTLAKSHHLTLAKVLDRWFSLLGATLAGAASNCIQNTIPSQDQESLDSAIYYTVILLVVFVILGAVFFRFKKKLESSETDEDKDGLTGMTPKELLSLTVDEGINNFTAAIAAVLSAVWFGLATVKGLELICWTFVIGIIILLFGEWIQLELTKGSMAAYIWQLLNSLNQGNVSWFIGLAMSNYTEHLFGANNTGRAYLLCYWHWFVGLIVGLVLMEIFTFVSSTLPKADDSKPYGSFICTMLKGIPMYASGWILNDLVQYRWSNSYVMGTFVWCCMSAVLVVSFDQFLHMRSASTCFGIVPHDDVKFVYIMTKETVSLLQQTLAFICGNMAGFIQLPFTESAAGWIAWIVWAILFQVVAFLFQGARTSWLPKAFKAVDAREVRLTSSDYISLSGV